MLRNITGRRGTLLYDPAIDRPIVLLADGTVEELRCGASLTLLRDGQTIPAHLEIDFDDRWYYAGTDGLCCLPGDIVYLDSTT